MRRIELLRCERMAAWRTVAEGIMGKLWLMLSILFLSGCCGMFGKQSPVVEVSNPEEVEDCRLLGKFTQEAGEFIAGTPYMGSFKDKSIREAEKIGATHILYRAEIDGDSIRYSNVIYAYRCPEGHEASRDEEEKY